LALVCAQVVVLLNGKPVIDYTFSAGVFKTTCAPAHAPSLPPRMPTGDGVVAF